MRFIWTQQKWKWVSQEFNDVLDRFHGWAGFASMNPFDDMSTWHYYAMENEWKQMVEFVENLNA